MPSKAPTIKRLVIAAVCLSLTLVLNACGAVVPDVHGMTLAQATKSIESAGYYVGEVEYDENARKNTGRVITQTPQGSSRAEDGSRMNLTLAGPPPVEIPNLAGSNQATGEAILKAVGLTGTFTVSYDASVAAGDFVSQSPGAGTIIPKGSLIELVFSNGPRPIDLPQVVGKLEEEARGLLESGGFKVQAESRNDPAQKGMIIAQIPTSSTALPGTTVTITVSTGVVMVRVPNVYGIGFPDAIIRQAGLIPKDIPIHGPQDSDSPGYLLAYRQYPPAGTFVPRGTVMSYRFWWEEADLVDW